MYNNLDNVNIKELNKTTKNGNSLEDAIKDVMEGADYEIGAVEAAQATANKAATVIAKLLVTLLDKDVINETELKAICKYIF
jgi:hypothetical protein